MGLSTAPCLAPRQVNKACQANGIFESAGFVQSSADLKSEANLAKIMSPRKDVQKPHSGICLLFIVQIFWIALSRVRFARKVLSA